jgi:hypothetical protein
LADDKSLLTPKLLYEVVLAAIRGSSSSASDVEPRDLPTRALRLAVWGDRLLSLLTEEDAGGLACTCEAVRRRISLHTRVKDLGEELKKVDVEVEATRRKLGLVEVTEQQLAAQGQADTQGGGTEVSGGAASESAIPSDARACATVRISGFSHAVRPSHARCRAAASLSSRGPFLSACGRTTCCRFWRT